jgi:hypothetical protein
LLKDFLPNKEQVEEKNEKRIKSYLDTNENGITTY